jgi:hypothetical protein
MLEKLGLLSRGTLLQRLIYRNVRKSRDRRAKAMTIEIQKPELEALILERMQKGGFASIEDALMQALEASPVVAEHHGKSRDRRTGADLIAALQASPYRELDIEPSRFRLTMPARDVTF